LRESKNAAVPPLAAVIRHCGCARSPRDELARFDCGKYRNDVARLRLAPCHLKQCERFRDRERSQKKEEKIEMKKYAIVAAASVLAGTAFAQTAHKDAAPQAPSAAQVQPGAEIKPSAQANEAKGISMAKSANFAVRFVAPKPANIMTSKLVGISVYNKQNENLGEIEDLAIENGKTITGVVVSVGGFLGMGERYVLVDPATIVVDAQNGTWKAFVDTTKESLKNAPQFHYGEAKS
jgi:sporulation protein YlmC with PRC-barrel domain